MHLTRSIRYDEKPFSQFNEFEVGNLATLPCQAQKTVAVALRLPRQMYGQPWRRVAYPDLNVKVGMEFCQ